MSMALGRAPNDGRIPRNCRVSHRKPCDCSTKEISCGFMYKRQSCVLGGTNPNTYKMLIGFFLQW